jgi:hypothetical protein
MSINVPTYLLRHSKALTLKLDLTTFTDRQLKNIAKQVSTGSISAGESATSRLAREIAHRMDSPFIRFSGWNISYKELKSTHPIFDAITQAVALTKLEPETNSSWYKRNLDDSLRAAENRYPAGSVGIYYMSNACKKIIKDAAKVEVPADHNVHAYLNKILTREINSIELDLT